MAVHLLRQHARTPPCALSANGFLRGVIPEKRSLQDPREKQDGDAADHIVPKVTDVGGGKEDEHHCLGENGAEENSRTAHVAKEKRDEKQAEDAPVENGSQNIPGLDKIFHKAAKAGDGDRDNAPAEREPSRRDNVMVVGATRAKNAIEIDGSRRPERVQNS